MHCVICDPPYFLESIGKRFGKAGAAPAKFGTDGAFRRAGSRFVGKTWDQADADGKRISFDPEFWRLVFEIMKPGAYLLAFASPRTGHRQATAIEDAGFVIHPFKGWAYTTGMPKQHPMDKAIMRAGGSEEEAAKWEGWAYGAQTEKPALEPIYVAQKPFSEKNGVENVRLHSTGAINIGNNRVIGSDGKTYHPANLVHDGSDSVMNELGDASKFFHSFEIKPSSTLILNPKATKTDRAGSAHPSVKPVALLRYLVRQYVPPGGVILDPFGGSGTTGEAAKQEGHECILIERDEDYVRDMEQRFSVVAIGERQHISIDDLL
ncbi:DNA-methyltransferase [Alterisphingorhabdus coralli]|uniref:site-specific DNA-methyltransferase (adenine-specific) n=1 Tax=Alterisphingorhabdus coralli TaxID=3071408 RepID=A0AA97I1R2_9SPHN|nr:site-specific DNA-methyltransferase [Parasphingorhabdus sp. SCSIO 66989]WOE76337.1 site-specific DNA-methyltransferase [Parasphingorhabdus sp. SCSIO 66989]